METTKTTMKQILTGHISPETAYVVDDYPYGFRLRCKIRYWLEYKIGHGTRLMSQTTNPKRAGEPWNKSKGSTYARFGGCMFLDENNHVQWTGLTEYCDAKEAAVYLEEFGSGVPPVALPLLEAWVRAKQAYERKRDAGEITITAVSL